MARLYQGFLLNVIGKTRPGKTLLASCLEHSKLHQFLETDKFRGRQITPLTRLQPRKTQMSDRDPD
jgi:hypothetical protein